MVSLNSSICDKAVARGRQERMMRLVDMGSKARLKLFKPMLRAKVNEKHHTDKTSRFDAKRLGVYRNEVADETTSTTKKTRNEIACCSAVSKNAAGKPLRPLALETTAFDSTAFM
mmetsp:Transcript_85201/g.237864  ORF Transcript_85201/g.237864 Transcript_85201/m.237864 type:complete len:115 (-) Transcript_85201:639-983(-)